MHVHYVEDNDIDAEILTRIAERDGSLQVTRSYSLEGLDLSLQDRKPDCILIDVMRPEALSVEDDVAQARRLSRAPIMFVTGGDAHQVRRRALKAGAEAVLDKASLSVDILRQTYANASARGPIELFSAPVSVDAEPEDRLNFNLQNLIAPLDYIESGLMTLVEGMRDAGKAVSAEFVDHIFSSVRAMKLYAGSDMSVQTLISLDALLRELEDQRVLVRASNQNWCVARVGDVALTVDAPREHYWQIGPSELAYLGFKHLLHGVLKLARPSDKIALRVERDAEGPRVVFYLSRTLIRDVDVFFSEPVDQRDMPRDALASLHLAALLLVLRRQQIELEPAGRGQKVSVHL